MKFSLAVVFLTMMVPIYDFRKTKSFLGCHRIPPLKGFSMQKFAGRWYTIARSDPAIHPNLKCTTFDFKYINSTTCNVTTSTKDVWTNKEFKEVNLLQQKYKNIPGIFRNNIKPGVNLHDNITVVDTDYRTYLVFHACLGNAAVQYEEAGIYGRKPAMDQKTLDKAKKQLSLYGFYTKVFLTEDQLDC